MSRAHELAREITRQSADNQPSTAIAALGVQLAGLVLSQPTIAKTRYLDEIESLADDAFLILTHIDRMHLPQECVAMAERAMHLAGRPLPGIFEIRDDSVSAREPRV